MNTQIQKIIGALALLALLTLNLQPSTAFAQDTAFTYQGRVTDNGTNFSGSGQFEFALVTSTNNNHTAAATANLTSDGSGHYYVSSYSLVSGGSGYLVTPNVTVSGGGGSGATATAVISGGVVTQINPNSDGSGYNSPPTVTIDPPPANITYTTYWSNDGTSVAGSEPSAAVSVAVTNGLFTVVLGDTNTANMAAMEASLFNQPNLQLRIWFNDGVNGFAALSPLQNLTPTPYAVNAVFANSASNLVSGISIQQNADGAPNIIEGSSVNYVSSGVEGATIAGGGAANVGGSSYTNSVTADFGTVGGGRNNTATNEFATVGGGAHNIAGGGDATVGGGGVNTASGDGATVGGGDYNIASGDDATVGGGDYNTASGAGAFVGGGGYDGESFVGNTASGNASVIGGGLGNQAINYYASVGGGFVNTVSGNSAVVVGGAYNTANGAYATVGGGYGNAASGYIATVSGGSENKATNDYATVPGGENNLAGGEYSFAAGQRAQALHQGSFVWADSEGSTFSSTTNDEFSIRAQNGVRIQSNKGIHLNNADEPIIVRDWDVFATNAPADKVGIGRWGLFMEPSYLTIGIPSNDVPNRYFQIAKYSTNGVATQLVQVDQSGNIIAQGTVTANGVLLTSDRNAKENFAPLDAQTVLAKVAALPMSEWNYKSDSAGQKHIGPMAQDFHAAFGLDGTDDKHISVIDEGGVALAAIQGLNQKLNEKDAEIQQLQQSIAQLKAMVNELAAQQKGNAQ